MPRSFGLSSDLTSIDFPVWIESSRGLRLEVLELLAEIDDGELGAA